MGHLLLIAIVILFIRATSLSSVLVIAVGSAELVAAVEIIGGRLRIGIVDKTDIIAGLSALIGCFLYRRYSPVAFTVQ